MNKKNNKGFSLVELIVVVAIMAVLVGVLAPAYLKYVENSREKKDLNNLEEVRHAVEVVLADEEAFAMVKNGTVVKIDATGDAAGAISSANVATDATAADFTAKVTEVVGTDCELVSKAYNQEQTITILVNGTTVSVVAGTVSEGSTTGSGWAGAPAENEAD